MEFPFKTVSRTFPTAAEYQKALTRVSAAACWFDVEPHTGGAWTITVKEEVAPVVFPKLDRWFAFCDTEALVGLGEHEDYSSASGAAEKVLDAGKAGAAVWLFNETTLRLLRAHIDEALGDQRPKPRVQITVRGGVASYVADDGIQVELIDWDDRDASHVHVQHEVTTPPLPGPNAEGS